MGAESIRPELRSRRTELEKKGWTEIHDFRIGVKKFRHLGKIPSGVKAICYQRDGRLAPVGDNYFERKKRYFLYDPSRIEVVVTRGKNTKELGAKTAGLKDEGYGVYNGHFYRIRPFKRKFIRREVCVAYRKKPVGS